MSVAQIEFQIPLGVLASLHWDPQQFGRELRLAAAVIWYDRRMVSQERAADIAGLSRSSFIEALGRFRVSQFQVSADDIINEVDNEKDMGC